MRYIANAALVAAIIVLGGLTLAHADQTILGHEVLLKQKLGSPATRTVTMTAKEVATTSTLTGDPHANGASLTVTTEGTDAATQTFTLDATLWQRKPANPALPVRAWTYKDPHGLSSAVSQLALKVAGGKAEMQVKISGKSGQPENIVPPAPGDFVGFVLTIDGPGGDDYCVNFGGAVGGQGTDGGQSRFEILKPTSEGTCPPAAPVCGDGIIEAPAENCDVGNDAACPGLCPSTGQTPCRCPSSGNVTVQVVHDSGATGPRTGAPGGRTLDVDLGWSGLTHDLQLLEGAQFTAELSSCDGTTDTLCDLHGATTGVSFGAATPLSAGGVPVCVTFDFASDLTGTLDLATGDLSEAALLHASMYSGRSIDVPCPPCITADLDPQVGEAGTCQGGPNDGMPCTVEALADPSFQSARGTSTACPSFPAALLGDFTVKLAATTGGVSFGTTAASPSCEASGYQTLPCLCAQCNDAGNTPCSSDADCPEAGGAAGICGGKRCFTGPRNGEPCTASSDCNGGACARAGAPTRPDECYTDVDLPVGCTAIGSGNAECANGPLDEVCAIQTFRPCVSDGDCPVSGDHCVSRQRACFLDPIEAIGTPDPPAGDVAHPVLVGTFCMGTSEASAINAVSGLPGPVRFVWPAEVSISQ